MKKLHNTRLLMVMSLVFCGQTMFGMNANTAELALLWDDLRLGNLEHVQAAIAGRADVNARNANGQTALTVAVRRGSLDIVQVLIAAGADINTRDNYGDTALMHGAIYNYLEIVEALIAAGADVNIRDNRGQTPLTLAVEKENLAIVNLIINADGFDPDQLQPIIDYLHAKENKTAVEQEILEVLEQRQTFNPMGLK